jgi:hypothetical protein
MAAGIMVFAIALILIFAVDAVLSRFFFSRPVKT